MTTSLLLETNARVRKIPIDGILGTNGEITTSNNIHKLKEFASVNELRKNGNTMKQSISSL